MQMEEAGFDPALLEQIHFIRAERFNQPSEVLETAKQVAASPAAAADIALMGFALFAMGDAYFSLGQSAESLGCLTRAQACLAHTDDWEMRGECSNMLGLLFLYQGNYTSSADCFFSGIALADAHELTVVGLKLRANLASVFEHAGEAQSALEYRLEAKSRAAEIPDAALRIHFSIFIYTSLTRNYLILDDLKAAGRTIADIEPMLAEDGGEASLEYYVYRADYAQCIGDFDDCELYLRRSLAAFADCPLLADRFEDCISLVRLLERLGQYQRLDLVLNELETRSGNRGFTAQWLELLECRVHRYHQQGLEREYYRALEEYFDACQENNITLGNSRRAMLLLKRNNIEMRQQNRELTVRAQTDVLTGLANRRRLNEMQELWFDRAQRNQERIGVAMLDIDHFKQLNDTCGHAAGDACLAALGSMLRRRSGSNIFCARYGGDEFVLLFRDQSDEFLLDFAEALRAQSQSLIYGGSPVTISIGIRNSTPVALNRIWDFTSLADKALYLVKKRGRNGVLLVHGPADFEDAH